MALGARFQAPRGSRFPWQVGGCTRPEWHRRCPPNARWERAPAEDGDVGAGSRPPSGPRLSGASRVPGPGASGRQRPSPVGPGPQPAASDGKQVRAEHSVRECEALTRKTKPGKRPTVTKAASDETPRGDRSRISRSVTVTTDRSAGAMSTWGVVTVEGPRVHRPWAGTATGRSSSSKKSRVAGVGGKGKTGRAGCPGSTGLSGSAGGLGLIPSHWQDLIEKATRAGLVGRGPRWPLWENRAEGPSRGGRGRCARPGDRRPRDLAGGRSDGEGAAATGRGPVQGAFRREPARPAGWDAGSKGAWVVLRSPEPGTLVAQVPSPRPARVR